MVESIIPFSPIPKSLEADGERFLPEHMHGSIELEHLHRYNFSSQLVGDKVVLDIASGEGYGSAYLARFARHVIGVDIAQEAVEHAKLKYSKDNLEYLVGTCAAIPLEDRSVDVVVSFETIEHHSEHEAMMSEIKRVLRPGGILIISSPDKYEYSEKHSFHNPFHVKELNKEEFQSLLTAHFKNVKLYGQRVLLGSALFSQGEIHKVVFNELGSESAPVSNMPAPLYWVAVASDKKLPATSGGIFEQPLAGLWQDITSQRNAKVAELIRAVAVPDSNLLKSQLNGSWYLQQNPDIVEAGVDPYTHWLNNGMAEGRLPATDPVVLARDLVAEREQTLNVVIEEKGRELRQAQHESLERQKVLEAEIVQVKLKARYEVDAQLRMLAERERVFAEQLNQLQQAANQERAAQADAAQLQMAALAERHAQQEQELRMIIEEKGRELRQAQHESLERQKVLEAEIVQVKLKAHVEVEAQLRISAERERAFGEQLNHLQQVANQAQAALKNQYSRLLMHVNNKLEAIQSTWSWSLTAPLRVFAAFIRTKSDFRPIDPHQFFSVFSSDEQTTATIYPEANVLDNQVKPNPYSQIDILFKWFNGQKYLDCNPDVAAAGANPYEHFMRYGWLEGRKISSIHNSYGRETADVSTDVCQKENSGVKNKQGQQYDANHILPSTASIQTTPLLASSGTTKNIAAYFMQSSDEKLQDDGYTFTRLMHYIWNSRLDLQNVFDIYQHDGRFEFCKWFLFSASKEYGFPPNVYPINLLEKLAAVSGDVGQRAISMLDAQTRLIKMAGQVAAEPSEHATGANLIGYAYGEFGMGEHVRMVARALNTTNTPFCIIDQEVGMHGSGDDSVRQWVTGTPLYNANIFHINADVFPPLYFKFGDSFFSGRRNIGYWAWELSKCPPEFDVALNMVDEVWAISGFVADSFKSRSPVPVFTMPLAVTVPALDASRFTKAYYGLPEDEFVFFFTFDAASYLDRKNPMAVVRAFNLAFPLGNENVHLLLKTMNIEVAGSLWNALLKQIDNDPRITIMSKRLTREEVLGLNLACDAFVSLHRSEGFGRCVAEAMAYGKPVIVTNYSGTRDFAMDGTACVVDYNLVPVPEGNYPFWKDQVWAEPNIEYAAALMKKLVHDEIYRAEVAIAGQKYVLDNFNESVIGERYAKRISVIKAMHLSTKTPIVSPPQLVVDSMDEIAGSIDAPTAEQCNAISDVFMVAGWVASIQGIECVDIYINSEFVGKAYYGILRQDVYNAFPRLTNAARSGFCYQVDITALHEGNHTLKVMAKSRSGEIKDWSMGFTLISSTKYQKWLEKSDQVYGNKEFLCRAKAVNLFSLLLKIEPNYDRALFVLTLKSFADQTHAKFEIIVIADIVQREEIVCLVESVGLTNEVQFTSSSVNDWMSKVTNCRGHLIGVVDVGDVLRPWALSVVDDVIQTNNKVGLIYADEDSILEGVRCKPIFKPGWSPIFLDGYNYIGRPWFALKSDMVAALSMLDTDNRGMNEHQLLKEIGSITSAICHIPSVLVSRHCYSMDKFEPTSVGKWTTGNGAEMIYPKVSIIIPTRLSDIDIVDRCLSGLNNLTEYPELEVIIVANNVADSSLIENYLVKWPFKVIHWNAAFSWSGINNFGAAHATGDYLLFMNDDVEPLHENWLKVMVQTIAVTSAGVVGPLLKYPNGTIQHLGINFIDYGGSSRHLFRFCNGNERTLKWLMNHPREVSAVTGACLLTTKDLFNDVGGFDEELPLVCNDTDFCLKVAEMGYSIVIQPSAKLIHHEGVSRAGMPEVDDVSRFWEKWGKYLKQGDQFTNPNLDATRDDWTVNPDLMAEYRYRISNRIFQEINHERV